MYFNKIIIIFYKIISIYFNYNFYIILHYNLNLFNSIIIIITKWQKISDKVRIVYQIKKQGNKFFKQVRMLHNSS